jgi:localization factor PodJL
MKPGIPWSVKGIDSEAREAAKHAARRSGMTLGEWLNTVIREQAEDDQPPSPPKRQAPGRNPMADIQSKLDILSEQLTRMSRRDQDTTAGRYYERSRPAQPEQSLADILARVEASERHVAENFAEFGERLETLGDRFAKERFPQEPEDVPGYHSLETALRNIVDHIEVSERKTRESMKSVQERIDQVAYAATAPIDSDRLLADAPVIARLENRISDLTSRITGRDDGGRDDLRKLVQSEVSKLSARIDGVKQASEMAAERARQQAQKDLQDTEARMQDSFGSAHVVGELGHLRAEMESLGQRVDDLKAEAASENDLRSLRVVIEQLSARVAQGPDLRPLADLDRRLTEITRWLEQGRGDHVGNQIADLEQRVFELDKRIAESMRQDNASQAWAGVEREFAGLSERLGTTEQQLQHIQTLEQSIHQLYQSVEQNRNWAQDVAEDAANRMASRLIQDWPGKVQAMGSSPELRALEDALAAVRSNYETSDQRNQETLGAVHETLEQIVNKLTELEQLRGEPMAAAQAEPVLTADAEIPPAADAQQSWPDLTSEQRPAAFAPLDPPSPPPVEPVAPVIQDDFIAAARRAAQAAAQQTPGPSAAGLLGRQRPTTDSKPKASSRFSLRFRRREKPPLQAGSLAPAAPAKASGGSRRRLILIGLVVLTLASVVAYTSYIKKPADEAPATPPAVEQTKPKGSSGVLQEMGNTVASSLGTVLAKSDAVFGSGNFASSLPIDVTTKVNDVTTTANEVAINDADALPAGIGSQSLRQAALDGDANAAFIVGARFAEGRNVPQDYKAAARWYRIAAAKGLAPAQYRLGTLLERGSGMTADLEDARLWYERAAAAGNVRAMHNAAVLFANGEKTKVNYEKAAHWFEEAAAHNLKDSQFNVAVLYERGLGVDQNLGEAFFWYSLAARQNDQDAAAKAKTLETTLPRAVSAEIKTRLAQWQPKADLDKANVVSISNREWQDNAVAAQETSDMPTLGAAVQNIVTTGNLIAEAQTLLSRLGFDVGEINGTMSSRTRNSIRLFELQSGMQITGEVTPELLGKLRAKAG